MVGSRHCAGLAGPLALTMFAFGTVAHAQQSERDAAARRALLEQAQQASDSGDHARALDLATRAGALAMSPSLRMFIAEEHAHLGQAVASLGAAELCVREAERDLAARNRTEVLARCHEIEIEQRSHVGDVVVHVPSPPPPGLRVVVAGEELNPALYGMRVPAAVGSVTIEATSRGAAPFRTQVDVRAGGATDVAISFGSTPPGPNPTPPSQSHHRPGAAPFVVLGLGAVSFGAAVAFFLVRNAAIAGCDTIGDELVCYDTASYMRAQDAPTWNTLTNVALGVGAALAVAGGVWLAIDLVRGEHAPSDAHRVRLDLAPTAGGGAVTVSGAF